jgi:hypothetical protein
MSEIMGRHVICDELTNLVVCMGVAVWLSCGGDLVIPNGYALLYMNLKLVTWYLIMMDLSISLFDQVFT